jgi:hypothetical protein
MKITKRQLKRIIKEEIGRVLNEADDDSSKLPGQSGYDERWYERNDLYHAIMNGIREVVTAGEGRYYAPPSSIEPDLTQYLSKTFEFKHTSPKDIKPLLAELLAGPYYHGSGPVDDVQHFGAPRSEHRYGTKVIAAGDREEGTLKPGDPGTGPEEYWGPDRPEEQKRWDQDGRQIR